MIIHQTIDLYTKFRYNLITIDCQFDEKTSHFDIKLDYNKSESKCGQDG